MSYGNRRDELGREVRQFVARYPHTPKNLVLDGTGPRVTMLLPYLKAAGEDTLAQFDKVCAFSGGVYAYLNYLAYQANAYLHSVSRYMQELDKTLRAAHRQGPFQLLRMCANYIGKRPLYADEPFRRVVEFSFKPDFLRARLVDVAPNFYPFVGVYGLSQPVPIDEANGFSRQTLTVGEALAMAVKIPFLYGGGTVEDKYFDANYAEGFLLARQKLLRSGRKTLVMTMWNQGEQENVQFVNICPGKNPRAVIRKDIASILFNIPNPKYRDDLQMAYTDQDQLELGRAS
jgi:hypothetical protein